MGAQRDRARKQEPPEEYVVLSFPIPEIGGWSSLTTAERAVARMLLSGMSNLQIAGVRGRSVRTIANQVAAIFHKLGVRSRAELRGAAASR